jgi:hypothetical protein
MLALAGQASGGAAAATVLAPCALRALSVLAW